MTEEKKSAPSYEGARGMLGLCVKAGNAVFGEDLCLAAIRAGHAGLVAVDEGASENAVKRYTDACRFYRVPLARTPEGFIEESTGKKGRIAVAITGGFAKGLRSSLRGEIPELSIQEDNGNNCGGASVE